MAISDWPAQERPREKLLTKGVCALSDAELLAIFLRTGVIGKTAVDLARELLQEHRGLRNLLAADRKSFCANKGLGPTKYVLVQAALELGRRYLRTKMQRRDTLTSPADTRDFLKAQLQGYAYEVFACVFLDNRHRVIEYEELFRGTVDGASVHPREVVRRALHHNAAALIFAHNHPSGVAEPSQADSRITLRLKDALALVDIRLLDHFVIGDGDPISFAERGLI